MRGLCLRKQGKEVALIMRRIMMLVAVAAFVVAMMAFSGPAFAQDGASQQPHQCLSSDPVEVCQHRVTSPSGQTRNFQEQVRGLPTTDTGGGADVTPAEATCFDPGGTLDPQGICSGHQVLTPSGNLLVGAHENRNPPV